MVLDPMSGRSNGESILDLASTLRDGALDAPAPFTGGSTAVPRARRASRGRSVRSARKILAISPFLSRGTLARLRAGTEDATLLTRADSADLLGASATRGLGCQRPRRRRGL